RQPMAANVDDVVDAPTNPVEALMIPTNTVTRELELSASHHPQGPVGESTHIITLVHIQVCVHVPLVGAPDGTGHARPRLLEGQDTLDVVPMDLLSRDWV